MNPFDQLLVESQNDPVSTLPQSEIPRVEVLMCSLTMTRASYKSATRITDPIEMPSIGRSS